MYNRGLKKPSFFYYLCIILYDYVSFKNKMFISLVALFSRQIIIVYNMYNFFMTKKEII